MKNSNRLSFLTIFPSILLLALASQGAPAPGFGPATVSLTATFQSANFQLVTLKTNHTSTTTNFNYVYKSTTTNLSVHADYILDLLTNSFNTNFPAGARLLLIGTGGNHRFAVSDGTGTNIFLDVSSVLAFASKAIVRSGVEMALFSQTGTNSTITGNDTETWSVYAAIQYDDSAHVSADGTKTVFGLGGIMSATDTRNLHSSKFGENLMLPVVGGGTIRGVNNVILNGNIHALLGGVLLIN